MKESRREAAAAPYDPATGEIRRMPIERQAEIVLEQMKLCLTDGACACLPQQKNRSGMARGGFAREMVVKRFFRPWQAWQRPTLPSLET